MSVLPVPSGLVGDALQDAAGAILTKGDLAVKLMEADRAVIQMYITKLLDRIQQLEEGTANAGQAQVDLQTKMQRELANHEDIFEYLRAEIHKKNGEVNELKEQKLKLMEDQEQMAQENERTLQEMQDKAMEEKSLLQMELASVKAELKRVEIFIKKEAELEQELAEKKRMIEDQAQESSSSISDLERKHVQEKDRLKKEMLLKLRETKANLLKMTDNQLDTTTKRTIAENEQMSSELAWQSKETEKLIRKNDKLVAENKSLMRALALHKQTEEEFARKVNVYQKTIKTLLSKLNALDSSQQAELHRMRLEDDGKERERAEALRERESLQDALRGTQERLVIAHEELSRLQASLQDVEGKYNSVLTLQDEAVKFTLQCLADTQDGRLTQADHAGGQRSLQTLDAAQREQVVSYLLEQLQAYQQQLKELELHNAMWRGTSSVAPLVLPPIGSVGPTPPVESLALRPWGKRITPGPTRAR